VIFVPMPAVNFGRSEAMQGRLRREVAALGAAGRTGRGPARRRGPGKKADRIHLPLRSAPRGRKLTGVWRRQEEITSSNTPQQRPAPPVRCNDNMCAPTNAQPRRPPEIRRRRRPGQNLCALLNVSCDAASFPVQFNSSFGVCYVKGRPGVDGLSAVGHASAWGRLYLLARVQGGREADRRRDKEHSKISSVTACSSPGWRVLL